ncbi:kelch-like protein 28 [Actinia tenebrosa]|uniref:Kelch-like protein 28 n=1 Tax=Actinia tenebrosa TaxID=6105 RepID=A0A6P8I173_ACTTE|nr:kelch-like protein 28 [Actinia tenebrosa]
MGEIVEDVGSKKIDRNFKLTVYSKLNELRQEDIFCDVSLSVEDQIFPANKIVLAAASPYFFGLFTNDLLEKTSNVIKIEALSASMIQQVLHYMYTGEVIIEFSNAKEIIMAADYLMMQSLKSLASSVLLENLSSHNCIDLFGFGVKYSCMDLVTRASDCMLEKFENASLSEYFKELDFTGLESLISEDDLEVEREEHVLNRVLDWVKYDISGREEYLPQLLRSIRLFSMSKESLTEYLEEEDLIKENALCTNILKKSLDMHLFPDLALNSYQHPRNCVKKNIIKVAIVVGGHIARMKSIPRLVAYALPNGDWYEIDAEMQEGRSRHCAAVCRGSIFILGGISSIGMEMIDIQDKTWNSSIIKTQVFSSTKHSAIVSFQEKLLLFGGQKLESNVRDEFLVLNDVGLYEPQEHKWKKLTPMSCPRTAHCAVLVDSFVYVVGGCSADEVYQSGEKYDIENDQWVPIAAMNERRCYAAGANLRGKVFIAGGYHADEWVAYNSCELYDPETDHWDIITSMPIPRAACGVAQVDDDIFLFGGECDGTPNGKLDSVVLYNKIEDSWKEVTKMPVSRSCLQVCLLNLPKTALVPLQ